MTDTRLSNADLAPVPREKQTWNWWHIASLWIGMAICIPTYALASSLVDSGWSWQMAVAAVVLGNVVVLGPIALNSHAGTRYGVPFPVLARASFGVTGAHVPSLLRAGVACGWFGIQTWIGGWAIFKLVEALWPGIAMLPVLLPEWAGLGTGEAGCFLLFWAINLWIVLRGMDSIKVLETWGSPFLLAVGVALFVWAWARAGGLEPMLRDPPPKPDAAPEGSVFGAGLTSAVAFWGTMALSIPDFSRYAKSQKDQLVGQAVGLPLTMALFAFLGASVTNATVVIFGERIADPVALLARVGGPFVIVLSMLGLVVATLTTNLAANVVAPANSFSNLAPRRISFKAGAFITAVIGIVMMPWKLYNDPSAYVYTWLGGYGALLGPIAGIMIVDYFLVRGGRLDVDGLYRRGGPYEFRAGVNGVAIAALVLGVLPSLPGFVAKLSGQPTAPIWAGIYDWAWFAGFGIAGVCHLVGMRILASPPPAIAGTAR